MKKLRYCEQCGSALPDGVRYCENCGAPLSDAQLRENAHEKVQEPVFSPRRESGRPSQSGARRSTAGSRPTQDSERREPSNVRSPQSSERREPSSARSPQSSERQLRSDAPHHSERRAASYDKPGGERREMPRNPQNSRSQQHLPYQPQRMPYENQQRPPHPPQSGYPYPNEKRRDQEQQRPSYPPQNSRPQQRPPHPPQNGYPYPNEERRYQEPMQRPPHPPQNGYPYPNEERRYQEPMQRQPYPPQNGYPYSNDGRYQEPEEEDSRGFTALQSVLLGIIGVLTIALIAFLIYWAVGRTRSRDTADRQNPQPQTNSVQQNPQNNPQNNQDAITILDGNGQPQTNAQNETDKPSVPQTETQPQTKEPETEEEPETIPEEWTDPEDIQIIDPNQPEASNRPDHPAQQAASDEYILSGSSERSLTDADVAGMSYDEMQMAINEIYARHGRKFSTGSINDYFESKSWYRGTLSADEFSESVFSQVEGQNIQFLLSKMGIQ